MSAEMDQLVADVKAEDSVIASAILAFQGLAAQITNAGAPLLGAEVLANANRLAGAVHANTK